MAFPTIPTVAAGRVLSVLSTNPAGTHTSPDLSSLTKNAGDLLIAIVITYDGNSTNAEFSSWGGSFTEFFDSASTTTMGIGCAYKRSTGAETGTFTVTSADTSANDSAFFLLSIPGAHNVTIPEAGARASGTSAAADPGSFDPASWGAEDTLWIAVGASGEDSTTATYTGIAAAPADYGNYADSGISADAVGGVEGAVAFRQLNASSVDVGTFSVDVSNARNAACVIAVRPAVVHSGAAVSPYVLDTIATGKVDAKGTTISPYVLGAVTNGVRTTQSAVSFPITLDATTNGVRTRLGAVVTPIVFGIFVDGTAEGSGPEDFFGVVNTQLTLGITTNGVRTRFGSSVTPLSLAVLSAAYVGAKSRVDFPITFGITTAGFTGVLGVPPELGRPRLALTQPGVTGSELVASGRTGANVLSGAE